MCIAVPRLLVQTELDKAEENAIPLPLLIVNLKVIMSIAEECLICLKIMFLLF